jgi:hypothetical protein
VLSERDVNATNIPLRVFLYTVDQLSLMLNMSEDDLLERHMHFEGRSADYPKKWLLHAVNIAPPTDKPEWRVADKEFIRWLKFKGFRIIERGYVSR